FTAREGYDLKRIALLGWSEAQRNEGLRATMRGFYLAFRDQIEAVLERGVQAGRFDATVSRKDAAKALLAAVLGFVVQSAILGDVDPAEIAGGLAGFAASGRL
ncbi:MAG TPA: TetR family transcriptional regulator C-terminal domain-containing protein, partial [Bosea sp. (in: a-proteobacteria)]